MWYSDIQSKACSHQALTFCSAWRRLTVSLCGCPCPSGSGVRYRCLGLGSMAWRTCPAAGGCVFRIRAGTGTAGGAPLIIHCTGSLRLQSRPATIAMLVQTLVVSHSHPNCVVSGTTTRVHASSLYNLSQAKTRTRASVPASFPSIICAHACTEYIYWRCPPIVVGKNNMWY